jgi:hypothetical protein
MGLGGGTFTLQNKVLPGAYINVVSVGNNNSTMGERGVVALPIALHWGNAGEVITVTAEDFAEKSMKIFGYSYDSAELQPIRELFKNAVKLHLYNLADGSNSKAAECANATAKKAGSAGNSLKLVVQKNIDDESLFDVALYMGSTLVFSQTVASASELSENVFVDWKSAELTVTAGLSFTGGADGTVDTNSYQNALNAFESHYFNILVCPEATYVDLYVAYTKRMRDEVGIKFQTVIPKETTVDYEGVIQLLAEQASGIYWAAGALAGCAENASCTNKTYDGELTIPTQYTRVELEGFIKRGIFAFHDVEGDTRVLVDINSLVTFTVDKNDSFSSNQVIRVADGCSMDAARIFNNQFLGKIQNDAAGRVSLWNAILSNRREREVIRAIDLYDSSLLQIKQGEKRNSVVVTEVVVPISTMEKLYLTTVIN